MLFFSWLYWWLLLKCLEATIGKLHRKVKIETEECLLKHSDLVLGELYIYKNVCYFSGLYQLLLSNLVSWPKSVIWLALVKYKVGDYTHYMFWCSEWFWLNHSRKLQDLLLVRSAACVGSSGEIQTRQHEGLNFCKGFRVFSIVLLTTFRLSSLVNRHIGNRSGINPSCFSECLSGHWGLGPPWCQKLLK